MGQTCVPGVDIAVDIVCRVAVVCRKIVSDGHRLTIVDGCRSCLSAGKTCHTVVAVERDAGRLIVVARLELSSREDNQRIFGR